MIRIHLPPENESMINEIWNEVKRPQTGKRNLFSDFLFRNLFSISCQIVNT